MGGGGFRVHHAPVGDAPLPRGLELCSCGALEELLAAHGMLEDVLERDVSGSTHVQGVPDGSVGHREAGTRRGAAWPFAFLAEGQQLAGLLSPLLGGFDEAAAYLERYRGIWGSPSIR